MNTLPKAAAILCGALLLFVATFPAGAQAPEGQPAMGAAPASQPAVTPPVAAPTPAAAEPVRTGGEQIEKDLDLYWGAKRRVRVVERQLHTKSNRFEIGLLGGLIPNDTFLNYYAAGARVGYFASESFSFEATYAMPFVQQDTKLKEFLQENFTKIEAIQENDQFQHMAHLNLVWTPFYGKMALLNWKLVHFDLGLFVGGGWLQTSYKDKSTNEDKTRSTIEGNAGGGFRLHLGDYVAFRFDVHQYFFKKVQGGLSHPVMLSIGFSTLVPYPTRGR